MNRRERATRLAWRGAAAALAILTAFFLVRGCAFMPWNARGGKAAIRVTVCADFGKETLKDASLEVRESSSAMEALRAVAEVETAYGGGFIQAVDGIASQYEGGAGRKKDWFFYVNGQMADVGAGAYEVREGDWLVFDFHSWEYAMFTPALAGCFPEPFVHGYAGAPERVTVACARGSIEEGERVAGFLASRTRAPCGVVELDAEWRPGTGEYAVLVGTWEELAANDMAREACESRARAGMFAYWDGGEIRLLDGDGKPAGSAGGSAGLAQCLGLRLGEGASALVLAGSDAAGLRALLDHLLDEDLREPRPVPAVVVFAGGNTVFLPAEGS